MFSQTQTVGAFLNTPEAFDGYTLLDPMLTGNTYLIDNCGHVIQSWSSDFDSGGACYLLEDGSLARGCKVSGAFSGGGVGGRLERRSWDNELIWTLDWADDQQHHHHDFAWMPNGNVLVLAWELRTEEEAASAGRINPQMMWPETITEIAPTLPEGGEVVWEWRAWDHLIQDADSTLPHYGVPSEHPFRINVNYENVGGGGFGGSTNGDWTHANAVNYNPELDQIAISSRRFNEIWILNHGITTEEAAGPAGDLLYRYGNPESHGRGDDQDQVFFGQHDIQWIPEGHPQAGQLMVYNNGGNRPGCMCSTVDVWMAPLLEDGSYALEPDSAFGPDGFDWTYPEDPSPTFFSPNISGVQPQPNGNFLICEGANGRLFEVDQQGQMVWEYVNPEGPNGISPQGSNPQNNSVFRAYRYAPDFPGFAGLELTPGELLEGASGFSCELHEENDTTSSRLRQPIGSQKLTAFPNPTFGLLNVTFPSQGQWSVMDVSGRCVKAGRIQRDGQHVLNLVGLEPGVWVLSFQSNSEKSILRIILDQE